MARMSRKSLKSHKAQFLKLSVLVGQKSKLRHIVSKVLKIEFIFEYTRFTKKR